MAAELIYPLLKNPKLIFFCRCKSNPHPHAKLRKDDLCICLEGYVLLAQTNPDNCSFRKRVECVYVAATQAHIRGPPINLRIGIGQLGSRTSANVVSGNRTCRR